MAVGTLRHMYARCIAVISSIHMLYYSSCHVFISHPKWMYRSFVMFNSCFNVQMMRCVFLSIIDAWFCGVTYLVVLYCCYLCCRQSFVGVVLMSCVCVSYMVLRDVSIMNTVDLLMYVMFVSQNPLNRWVLHCTWVVGSMSGLNSSLVG